MIDEHFDRQYQAGREALNASLAHALSRFGQAIGKAFQILNKIEYRAPWTASGECVRHD